MPISTQTSNVKLGACTATYKGTALGLTKGGVEVTITTNKHEVMVDQFGTTKVNSIITGRAVTVKVPLAETDFNKLLAVMPGAVVVTGGGKTKLTIPHGAGTSLANLAGKLTLHPTIMAPGVVSDDAVFPLAAPGGDMTFSYTVDAERIYNVEFTVFPDETTGLMLILGDETAV